jgi:endonuclease YncB( thermonuclease family)
MSKSIPIVQGLPYTYKLKDIGGKLHLDLGLRSYYKSLGKKGKYDDKSIIQVTKGGKYSFKKIKADENKLHVYKAYVESIVDGNSIIVNIDFGFDIFSTHKLRLNGMSAGNLNTDNGLKAKNFIKSKLSGLEFIVIKTYSTDKFDKYIADIFYSRVYSDMESVIISGNFLNQELLDSGLAIRQYVF